MRSAQGITGLGIVRRALRLSAVLAGLAAGAAVSGEQPPSRDDGCHFPEQERVLAAAAADAGTLLLADGRLLRLAGIEAPRPREPGAGAALATLQALVQGRSLTIRTPGAHTDRYGRLVAYVEEDNAAAGGPTIQERLLRLGHARVAGRVDSATCAAALLSAERAARDAGAGLWKLPYYAVRRAEDPDEVLAERGRFTLVAGRVLSVRESGGTVYVNFGRRFAEDFTVTVRRRDARTFAAAGRPLPELAGRQVLVRGIVERRGGPWIEALRPEQIEVVARD